MRYAESADAEMPNCPARAAQPDGVRHCRATPDRRLSSSCNTTTGTPYPSFILSHRCSICVLEQGFRATFLPRKVFIQRMDVSSTIHLGRLQSFSARGSTRCRIFGQTYKTERQSNTGRLASVTYAEISVGFTICDRVRP